MRCWMRLRSSPSDASVTDEYGTTSHAVSDPDPKRFAHSAADGDKKLLIADGHHRYETALEFSKDHPEAEDAKWVMMTFVNHALARSADSRHSSRGDRTAGLRSRHVLQQSRRRSFEVSKYDTIGALRQLWKNQRWTRSESLFCRRAGSGVASRRDRRNGELDVEVLHSELLEGALGIDAEAVREQKFLKYVRGIDAAADRLQNDEAEYAFLLEATTINTGRRLGV